MNARNLAVPASGRIAVVLIATGVVVLGCAPNLLVGNLLAAVKVAGLQ